jgi:hypothetical protein
MKIRTILREIQQSTSKFFDNYKKENEGKLNQCREMCKEKGYPLNNQHDEYFFKEHGKLMNIPINKIQIGQKKVESKVLDRKGTQMDLENYKPIHVFKFEGNLYLHDGHHRTVNLIENGKNTVKGYVVNLDKMK